MAGSQEIDVSTPKLRGYLEVKHFPSNGRSRARLPRKWWRRQWVVLDIVETLETPALIGRIYNSHLHEDRTLPSTTVTLTDVHALHRIQSRSHPFAFSIDGNCQCLILSGQSETESQLWMKQTRQLLWPRSPPIQLWPRQDLSSALFEVSLIDNVHSDIVRLRGFYGHLVIEGREVVLLEARSGHDQIRWPIKSLKKWFCAKVSHKEDRGKILVIISHKNSSSGEGIFTFYAPRAREIVNSLEAATKSAQRQPLSALEGKKSGKMNPLLAFLRRSSTPTSPSLIRVQQTQDPHQGSFKSGSKSKTKSQMGKSASVMDNLSPRHSANVENGGRFEKSRHQKTVTSSDMSNSTSLSNLRRGISLERHSASQNGGSRGQSHHGEQRKHGANSKKKKSSSESDLLSAGFNPKCGRNGYANQPSNGQQVDPDFPAPPRPEELLMMTASDTLHTVTGTEGQEGFYRSFDDIDDIDLGVLASSNPLEAAVVLRSQPESSAARYSFNSSDSGRMSDTYGETSNSSVASSSGHSNRICSNTSNCSGDSGAQMSDGSSKESKPLEVLKEQVSPDYPPFDNELYGETISIVESSSGSTTSGQHLQNQQQQTQQQQQQQQQSQQSKLTQQQLQDDKSEDYYYVPLRFATVRKSFTLPHNMSGSAATTPTVPHAGGTLQGHKTKDLSKFFGLIDNGPGSPTREVAQAVAMQNLPKHLRSPTTEGKKNVEKYLGISNDPLVDENRMMGNEPKRARPKSLGIVSGRSLERRASQDGTLGSKNGDGPATLNRTLARLQKFYSQDSRSVPTTPINQQSLCLPTSPRRKNLTRFLGLVNEKQQQPLPDTPTMMMDSATGSGGGCGLVKNSLSSSTPMVLESCDNDDIYHSVSESRWQSNDGLLTPGSVGNLSPFCRSPIGSPAQSNNHNKSTADKGVMTCDLDEPQGPYYNGYMFNPWPCQCQRGNYYGTSSATSSPFHTGPRGGGGGRGRAASVGRPQVGSLQRGGGPGTINRMRGVQAPRRLPRSMTLDDLDPHQYGDIPHQHLHHPHHQPQQQHQPRGHFCHQPQMQSLICTPVSRISRRESLGYESCSPCQMNSMSRSRHPSRGECCIPDVPSYCLSPQQQRASMICNQYQHQIDCHSLSRLSKTGRDGCRNCGESTYLSMGEMSVPTSSGVVVIPIAPNTSGQQHQQVSIISKANNLSSSYKREGMICRMPTTESDYLDMVSIRTQQKMRPADEPPLRESSVDTDTILLEGDGSCTNRVRSPFITSTVVGVGLNGKTCISVNEKSETKSVKIWSTNEDSATTNYVQTTAIVHPTPQS